MGTFSRRISGVLALVMTVALLGSVLGIWSLYRVSTETAHMVNEAMAAERLTGDLQRHIAVNVARSKALAMSSEPQVGDALQPEIKQTAAVVEALLGRLNEMMVSPEEQVALRGIVVANAEFLKASQALTAARDGGLTSNIEHVYKSRFAPSAQVLLSVVTQLSDTQLAKIDTSVKLVQNLSLSARWVQVIFGLCAVLLGGFLSVWLVRGITDSIRQAVDMANRVGALDLTAQIDGHDRDEGGQLLSALGRMQVALHTLVANVQGASRNVAHEASEIAVGNRDFSNRTELAASSLQQTAASVEQITATMQTSQEASFRGEIMAKSAVAEATTGRAVMSEVMQTMNDINASSRKIVDITAVIDSIAFQTNILALNAAIEAARSGAEGRGFAVVAAEVRALASRSAAAAQQIKLLINESVANVKTGTEKVNQARETMATIVDSVGRVAHVISEITTSTSEQSRGMFCITAAVNEMEQMTQKNAAEVENSANAALNLQGNARNLRDMAGQFRLPALSIA